MQLKEKNISIFTYRSQTSENYNIEKVHGEKKLPVDSFICCKML